MPGYTAAMVGLVAPTQLFWAYATCGPDAAGLAIVSGIQARLAAILLTTMYLIFTLIVHLPR